SRGARVLLSNSVAPDIRALYYFKRVMWGPYSMAMRRVNVFFTRALRPPARRG
ncbi:MAG: hypothetical protein ACXWZ2_07165, partial [Mycobacterium sp.]